MTKVRTAQAYVGRRHHKLVTKAAVAADARRDHESVPGHLLHPKLVSRYSQTVTVEIGPGTEKVQGRPLWENTERDGKPKSVQYTGILCPANSAERRRGAAAILEVPCNGASIRVTVPERALSTIF